nr:serine hydrolase domain-containing protein [Microlunatus antarcticus]
MRGPTLGPATTGDPALAADVRASFTSERGFTSLSAARVRDGQVTFAGLGEVDGAPPAPDTPYELGSITKTFTAALLADAVTRGEVRLDDPVATYLPELADTAAGASTLRALATHTAGLPSFPTSSTPTVLVRVVGNENPYAGTVEALLGATRTTEVTDAGTYRYSNLGVALLGHALARAADVPGWPDLVHDRLLQPLGMTRTVVVEQPSQVPAGAAHPHQENGWSAPFWTGPAMAPAGSSTVTTATDLATWARALLDGSAPGASALDPVADIPGGRIGLAWHVYDVEGRTVTWHNGGTGGTRTILALDRERGQAVLLLSSSGRDADTAGLRLAATAPGQPVPAVDGPTVGWAGLLGWNVVGLLLIGTAILRWRAGRGWPLVDGALAAATGLLVLLVHGPWLLVPTAVWVGLTLAVGVLAAAASLRRGGPPTTSRRSLVASLAGTAVVLAVALWTL